MSSFTPQVTSHLCRSLWPICHGPVILPCNSESIKNEGTILWILVQSGTVNVLILFVFTVTYTSWSSKFALYY